MKTRFVFVVLGLFFLACSKKQLPVPPNGNDPQFYFIGTVGNDSVHWQAGEDDFFMHTDFFLDAQKLIVLRGQLGLSNCLNCEPSLTIEFRDVVPSPDSVLQMNVATFFTNQNINSFSLDNEKVLIDKEEFSFYPSTQQPISNLVWDFGDGTQSTNDDPKHIFSGAGMRNVKLTINQAGYTDSLSFPINVGFQSPERVMFSWSQNANFQVNAQITAGNFSQYFWETGDGQFPTGTPINFSYATPGIYTLSCRATAGNMDARYKAKIKVPQGGAWANPNFTYTTKVIKDTINLPRLNKSTAIIELKKDGKHYRSFKSNPTLNQSGITVVRVINASPFELNQKGFPTLRVNMTVDTWLYNSQNQSDSVRIQSNSMCFAVAHPL
jgi:PKD repeat protein